MFFLRDWLMPGTVTDVIQICKRKQLMNIAGIKYFYQHVLISDYKKNSTSEHNGLLHTVKTRESNWHKTNLPLLYLSQGQIPGSSL